MPPNPPAGLLWVVVVLEVVVGAALLQPPKSSSCVTLGAFQLVVVAWAVDVVAAGWLGADDAQTSLPPQASMFENPE